jgi:hypothetical protein
MMAASELTMHVTVDTEGITELVCALVAEVLDGIEQLAMERIQVGEAPEEAYRLVIARAKGRIAYFREAAQQPGGIAATELKDCFNLAGMPRAPLITGTTEYDAEGVPVSFSPDPSEYRKLHGER